MADATPIETLQQSVKAHQQACQQFFQEYGDAFAALADRMATLFQNGNRLLLCGNGGSTCDAMHIAGEFVGRFRRERQALPAIALTADSGILTAVGNDYGFEHIFARQVEAHGQEGDMLIGLSTSGTSANVVAALATGRERGLHTILFTGEKGRGQTHVADQVFAVSSTDTARIQEAHITALHILTDMVEQQLSEAT